MISPAQSRHVLRHGAEGWSASVSHRWFPVEEADGLRRAIAANAANCVIGPTEASLSEAPTLIGSSPMVGSSLLTAGLFDLECHLYDWFRVAQAVAHVSPADEIRWSELATQSLWLGPLVVEIGFPERTAGGVGVTEDSITVDLEWGRSIRSHRREALDWRTGSSTYINFDQVQLSADALGRLSNQRRPTLDEVAASFERPDRSTGIADGKRAHERASALGVPTSHPILSGQDFTMLKPIAHLTDEMRKLSETIRSGASRVVPKEWSTDDH